MNLKFLMKEFLSIKYAEITFGPDHYENPREELRELFLDFIKEHSYLNDRDYHEFLAIYGGAGIYSEENSTSSNYTFLSIYELDGSLCDEQVTEEITEDGYFIFAEVCNRERDDVNESDDGIIITAYAFKASIEKGVYKELYRGSKKISNFELAYPSFIDFLEDIVSRKGHMLS